MCTGEQLGVALPQLDFSVAGPDMLVCIVLFCGLPLAYTLTKSMVKRIDEDQYTAQVSCLRMFVDDMLVLSTILRRNWLCKRAIV